MCVCVCVCVKITYLVERITRRAGLSASAETRCCGGGRSEDGRLSLVGGSSLRVSPVNGYDSALYTCRAFNAEDSVDADATLTVHGIREPAPRPSACVNYISGRICYNKKLSYRRGTARCVVSIEILPVATQQGRNYLYDKS